MRLMILGTGHMAEAHARAFAEIDGVEITACADRRAELAADFAQRHGIAAAYPSLDAALAAGGFDAVANVTPDAAHYGTTMRALAAGLHVFCEKPIATNSADADEMVFAARAAGVVHGVNLTYRNVSAIQRARELVAAGAIGALRHFEASYLQSWLNQSAWGDWRTEETWLWRLSTAHGSQGVLGDVGIHILDFLTYATESPVRSLTARLSTHCKAQDDRIGVYGLDANDSLSMTLELDNGASGVVHASRTAPGHLNDLSLKLWGESGGLHVTNEGPLGRLRICEGRRLETGTWCELPLSRVNTNYWRFAEAVETRRPMRPDFADAARLQRVIDAAFRSSAAAVEYVA